MGTVEGAVRFDGVRFTVFDTTTTPAMHANEVEALLEDRRGHLWLGTNGGGLNRLADGRFERYTTQDGLAGDYVRCLLEDRAGNIWIGTYGGGLSRFRDGRFTSWTTKNGLPDDHVRALALGPDGDLWIATSGGVARFVDGRVTRVPTRDDETPEEVYALR